MSSYAEVATEFRDADALVEALQQMGYAQVAKHARAVEVDGYNGAKTRGQIVVPKGSHDDTQWEGFAFEKQPNGTYLAHLSTHLPQARVHELKRSYAKAAVLRQARAKGYRITEERRGAAVVLRLGKY